MASLWPWLAVAGLGALHGLNPLSGWPLAAAWGLRSHGKGHALRGLLPIAAGHAASIALVAAAVVYGLAIDSVALRWGACGLLAAAVVLHLWGRVPRAARTRAGATGLVLWSFLASGAHGAGLMLVPALVPLCAGGGGAASAAEGTGMLEALATALAAVGVHAAAMLAATAAMASAAGHGFEAVVRRLRRTPQVGGADRAAPR